MQIFFNHLIYKQMVWFLIQHFNTELEIDNDWNALYQPILFDFSTTFYLLLFIGFLLIWNISGFIVHYEGPDMPFEFIYFYLHIKMNENGVKTIRRFYFNLLTWEIEAVIYRHLRYAKTLRIMK